MKNLLQNQKGSTVIITLWTLFIVGFLLIFIYNIAQIYIVKEQSAIAAEQASLAASRVVYEEIDKVIQNYEPDEEDEDEDGDGNDDAEDEEEQESVEEKVKEEKKEIKSSNYGISDNEAYIQAVNKVLLEEMEEDDDLKQEVRDALTRARNRVGGVVADVIAKNNGKVSKTEIQFFNSEHRIEVKTYVPYETVEYGDWIASQANDVPQIGMGLTIPFAAEVNWNNQQVFPN